MELTKFLRFIFTVFAYLVGVVQGNSEAEFGTTLSEGLTSTFPELTTPQDIETTTSKVPKSTCSAKALEPPIYMPPCSWNGGNPDNEPCPAGTVELFRDTPPVTSEIFRSAFLKWSDKYCCNTSHPDYYQYKNKAFTCETTTCTSSISDPCSTIVRFIDGGQTELKYEEIVRDSCEDEEDNSGVVALCCVQNSTESFLASALGAELNEFPHQAKLGPNAHCGGTVYNSRFVITAAHCVVDSKGEFVSPDYMRVTLGSNNGANDVPPQFFYGVNRVIVHPEYSRLKYHPNRRGSNRIFNDIALLELDRKVEFGDNIKALRIAPKRFDPLKYSQRAVIVGWGTTDTLNLSLHLQKANFLLRNDEACFDNKNLTEYEPYHDLKEQLLCVGGILEGKWSPTAGKGDSGGAAICRGPDGRAVLCGISSFGGVGDRCKAFNNEKSCTPSGYAEVSYFHDWIVLHAGVQDESFLYQPILYGESMKMNVVSHQVEINSADSDHLCGGTLIAPSFIVTAAHCVAKSFAYREMGILRNLTATIGTSTFEIEKVGIMRGFKEVTDDKFKATEQNRNDSRPIVTDSFYSNDLAVAKIKGEVIFSPTSLFPLLPYGGKKFDSGIEFAIPRDYGGKAEVMRREFKILGMDECQTRIRRMTRVGSNITVDKDLLCGVEKYSGGSLCDRSLGGGLICKGEGGVNILCGVQVFRFCEFSFPNAFINVEMYVGWIQDAIERLK